MTFLGDLIKAANAAICLINQVNFLLDRHIKSAENTFAREGDYGEQLRKRREQERKRQIVRRYFG